MPERRPSWCPRRATLLGLLAIASLAARPAAAQVQNLGSPIPSGLPLPITGAAVVEEPTATSVNPAGIGFLHGPSLQYFHVEGHGSASADGDGLYVAGLIGPFGPALSVEWLRPDGGPSYRLTTLGLSLSDGHTASLGVAWRWWNSPDPAIDPMHAWDLGLTLRPWRHLSLGASALGLGSRYQGQALPVQYDLGLGLRFLDDSVTLSADALANDQARNAFDVTGGAIGLALELTSGIAISAQYRFPVGSSTPSSDTAGILSLTWNAPHAGATAGAIQASDDSRWLVGVRTSYERYPSSPGATRTPRVDLADELAPQRFLFFDLHGRDPFGDLLRRLTEAGDDGEVGAVVVEIRRPAGRHRQDRGAARRPAAPARAQAGAGLPDRRRPGELLAGLRRHRGGRVALGHAAGERPGLQPVLPEGRAGQARAWWWRWRGPAATRPPPSPSPGPGRRPSPAR